MAQGTGNDLAVVAFSGHGAMVGDMFYLLPNDVDAGYPVAIQSTALSVDDFQRGDRRLAQHGRVIVLLDACHSGATTARGARPMRPLRELCAAPNIDVLTSSTAGETSVEDGSGRTAPSPRRCSRRCAATPTATASSGSATSPPTSATASRP